jgi:hypothetical protein
MFGLILAMFFLVVFAAIQVGHLLLINTPSSSDVKCTPSIPPVSLVLLMVDAPVWPRRRCSISALFILSLIGDGAAGGYEPPTTRPQSLSLLLPSLLSSAVSAVSALNVTVVVPLLTAAAIAFVFAAVGTTAAAGPP